MRLSKLPETQFPECDENAELTQLKKQSCARPSRSGELLWASQPICLILYFENMSCSKLVNFSFASKSGFGDLVEGPCLDRGLGIHYAPS